MQPVCLTVGVPGVCLLVLLRDEEPDKISITQPSFLIHPSVSDGINHKINVETQSEIKNICFKYIYKCIWYDKHPLNSIAYFSYLVTVPENILSIILWEMAGKNTARRLFTIHTVGGEEKGFLLHNSSLS